MMSIEQQMTVCRSREWRSYWIIMQFLHSLLSPMQTRWCTYSKSFVVQC